MRMDLASTFHPFDPADRPGAVAGGLSTHLSPADLSGVVPHGHRSHGKSAAGKSLGTAKTGMASLDAKRPAAPAGADAHADVEGYAKQLVNQTFFGTMLKQMRESPFKSDLFSGGRGGQAYSGMYDQKMVEQMSRGAGKRLVNSIVRKLEANKAYAKQGPAAAGTVPAAGANTHIAPVTRLTSENLIRGLHAARTAGAAAVDNHSNRNARPHDVPHVRA